MMAGYSGYNEKSLVSLVKNGDKAAMKAVYDKYAPYLSAVCARYVSAEDDRKDVLQECFIKIFTSLDSFKFRGEGSFKAWMARITVNESLRFLKKNISNDFIEYEGELPDIVEEPEVEGIPDDVVNDMILSLPPGYRMVFNLYVFEHKSHKEIAEMLNIGESSSASQFSRAKALLARKAREYRRLMGEGRVDTSSGNASVAGHGRISSKGSSLNLFLFNNMSVEKR